LRFASPDPETTASAARALAGCLPAQGCVLSLVGPLGAGKTAFVKGLAAGLQIDPGQVSSPTFVIANQYRGAGGRRLNHIDFYRLESADELLAAGWLDLLDRGATTAAEWGDRFPGELPADHVELRIERGEGELERRFTAKASGPLSEQVLEAWAGALREEGLA